MKGLLFCVGLIMNCLFSTVSFAQTQNVSQQDALANTQKQLQINRYKYSIKAPKAIDGNSDFNSMDITSHGGDLAKLLGDNIYKVDSLVVRGTVDDVDFHTLWDASFNGKLSVINMENAEVKNGIIPEDAFWHSEQLNIEEGYITLIHLRRIILPNGIKRIEDSAFSYVVNLEDVNIPSELQYIGPSAFEQCENLKTDPLVFPEGFEKLDGSVFANCTNLTGKVVLPSTIEEALSRQAGINFVRSGTGGNPSTNIDMRGQGSSANFAVKVMVDGILLNTLDNNRLHAAGVTISPLDSVAIEDIERIEIIPGGGAVLYGNGTRGGAINIITKKNKDSQATVSLQGTAFESGNVSGKLNLGFFCSRGFFCAPLFNACRIHAVK